MKKLLYVGPSWAVQNFEKLDIENESTSLLQELKLSATNLASLGSSNWENLLQIQAQKNYDGVVWIYCEPILDIETFKVSDISSFLQSEKFWQMRSQVNQITLEKINNLGCPVALIGAHSDIVDNNYNNLYTIHHSWQKFLCEKINLNITQGWGAEIAHRWFMRRNIKPSYQLVDKITEVFAAWKQLEQQGLFWEVHPNRLGNEIFAKHIKQKLNNWIDQL